MVSLHGWKEEYSRGEDSERPDGFAATVDNPVSIGRELVPRELRKAEQLVRTTKSLEEGGGGSLEHYPLSSKISR